MSVSDDLDQVEPEQRPVKPEQSDRVVEFDTGKNEGVLTYRLKPGEPEPTREAWKALVRESGFTGDADAFDYFDARTMTRGGGFYQAWEQKAGSGEWCRLFRVFMLPRGTYLDGREAERLISGAKRLRPFKPAPLDGSGDAFVVVLADWQMGKGEGGGSRQTIRRVIGSLFAARDRLRALRKAGHKITEVVFLCTGDLHEGCSGFYPMQRFQTDMDRRAQSSAVRSLLMFGLRLFRTEADRIRVMAVGGNHGENRDDSGKAFTTFADNDDVAVVEQVRDICAEFPDRFGHVRFVIPGSELAIVEDVAGVPLGLTHGHLARSGGRDPRAKIENWFAKQRLGGHPVGRARLLVTGHFHQFQIAPIGNVWWVQSPTLDPGSYWYEQTYGVTHWPGLATFRIGYGDNRPQDVEIHLEESAPERAADETGSQIARLAG